MQGVFVDAGSLEASFNSLLLESLQDLVNNKAIQASFGFNPTALGSGGGGTKTLLNSVGAAITKGDRHAVSALTALLGRDSAHIVVAHALELNGAMIANAQMDPETKEYTDHGQLSLEVGKLFIQHIHNYDESETFGIAVSLMQNPEKLADGQEGKSDQTDQTEQSNQQTQPDQQGQQSLNTNADQSESKTAKTKATIAPTIGYKNKEWYTQATIGNGRIIVRDNPKNIEQANRDVTRTTSETDESGFDTIHGYIPINHDYSDRPKSWEEVGERLNGAAQTAFDTVAYGAGKTWDWLFGNKAPELPQTQPQQDDTITTKAKQPDENNAHNSLDNKDEQLEQEEYNDAERFFVLIEILVEQDSRLCLIPEETQHDKTSIPYGTAGEFLHYAGSALNDIEDGVVKLFKIAADYGKRHFPEVTQELKNVGHNIADLVNEMLCATSPILSQEEKVQVIEQRKVLVSKFIMELEKQLNAFSTQEQRKAVEYLLPFLRGAKIIKAADNIVENAVGSKIDNIGYGFSSKAKIASKLDDATDISAASHKASDHTYTKSHAFEVVGGERRLKLAYDDDFGTVHYEFWDKQVEFKGNRVYQRNDLIDPNKIDTKSQMTNLELMKQGKAPKGPDGKPINLHHTIQEMDSAIAEMTETFHQKNTKVMHIDNPKTTPSKIDRNEFGRWREDYWKDRAKDFEGGK